MTNASFAHTLPVLVTIVPAGPVTAVIGTRTATATPAAQTRQTGIEVVV